MKPIWDMAQKKYLTIGRYWGYGEYIGGKEPILREGKTMKTNKITIKRINGFYTSSDGKWFICHEGSATWWYACELDEKGNTEEETKQYFRSYQQAKTYVIEQSDKAGN